MPTDAGHAEHVRRTAWRRELLIALGFLALATVGVATVMWPALEDEAAEPDAAADAEPPPSAADSAAAGTTGP